MAGVSALLRRSWTDMDTRVMLLCRQFERFMAPHALSGEHVRVRPGKRKQQLDSSLEEPCCRSAADAMRDHSARQPSKTVAATGASSLAGQKAADRPGTPRVLSNSPCQTANAAPKMAVLKNTLRPPLHHRPAHLRLLRNMSASAYQSLILHPQPNSALCKSPD